MNKIDKQAAIEKIPKIEGDIITLQRTTRANIPNDNGFSYTKTAYDEAMKDYMESGGHVYMAPVAMDYSNYDDIDIKELNTAIYRNFHHPEVNEDYKVGTLVSWDDYSISFKLDPTNICWSFVQYIIEETTVSIRYRPICTVKRYKPISKMGIFLLDLATIPYEALGIDPYKVLSKNKEINNGK